jgi:hypothetical protein
MFTPIFWRRSAELALRTAAQCALLTIGADTLDAFSVDWAQVGGFAVGGALLSLLTSMAGSLTGDPDRPTVGD